MYAFAYEVFRGSPFGVGLEAAETCAGRVFCEGHEGHESLKVAEARDAQRLTQASTLIRGLRKSLASVSISSDSGLRLAQIIILRNSSHSGGLAGGNSMPLAGVAVKEGGRDVLNPWTTIWRVPSIYKPLEYPSRIQWRTT